MFALKHRGSVLKIPDVLKERNNIGNKNTIHKNPSFIKGKVQR